MQMYIIIEPFSNLDEDAIQTLHVNYWAIVDYISHDCHQRMSLYFFNWWVAKALIVSSKYTECITHGAYN